MRSLRFILSFCAAGMLVAPTLVLAQPAPADAPRLEVGADAAFAAEDVDVGDARLVVAPRLMTRLSDRTALVIAADAFGTDQNTGDITRDSLTVTAEIRRALVQTERVSVRGFVGGGVGRHHTFQPGFSYPAPGRDETITVPATTHTDVGPEVTLGVGLEQRVAPRLALRQEVRLILGEVSDLRVQGGVSVPIGRYPPEFAPLRTRSGERPDSLANGTTIGAIAGTVAMTSFALWITEVLCEGDCSVAPAIGVGITYGGGTGALIGALIDSIIE